MKGQITRHEWHIVPRSHHTCIHCKLVRKPVDTKLIMKLTNKEVGRYLYYKDGVESNQMPKCITRKKPEDGDSTAT